MNGEQAVASEFDGVGAHGSIASTNAYGSVTELLDAVHRASFEVWWARDHRTGKVQHSDLAAIRRTEYPRI